MNQDIIFTPLRFRNLEVKNRIFRSSISGFDNEDGSLTQTRINWECKFAKGGIGAIISSYVPVLMEGRIIAGYATVHRDAFIPHWQKLGEAVHSFDCKFIMQLSHSGRQMDIPGVHNYTRRALSSTSRKETLHGILCRAMSLPEIHHTIKAFARGAWRAREAGLDGVELHAANGALFTQFLSSGINDRTDEYGGSLANRARFLLDVIQAIRAEVGGGFHLQVKISAVDHNNVIPWEKKGNTLQESVEVARWCEAAGADAIHVSTGSLFPHPLNPPGDFSFETMASTYDVAISSGVSTLRNYYLFRYPVLRPVFRWLWFRMKRGRPVEGVGLDEARAIKAAVKIPVISTGGWQSSAKIRDAINSSDCDGVAITDPRRLDSYTERLRDFQLAELFKGTEYQFKSFEKTFGYANLPLDGLWLRAPYLHNGSVPTLADLLEPPEKRPPKFVRGIDKVDPDRGGFVAPACDATPAQTKEFCFDTGLPGNNNTGHRYGTNLSPAEKSDLLAYLLTF